MSKFKVGDRVKAVGSGTLYSHNVGKEGVITEIESDGDIHVTLSDGDCDYGEEADFQLLPPAVNTDDLKADLMAAVEAGETEHSLYPMSSPARATFAKELLEKHFNLMRVPAAAAKWVEKESAA